MLLHSLVRLGRSSSFFSIAESVLAGFSGQALLLFSGIIVARLLGPEGRGYLALLVLFPSLLVQIALLGLPQAVTNVLAKNRLVVRELLRDIRIAFSIQLALVGAAYFFLFTFYTADKSSEVVNAAMLMTFTIPGALLLAYGLSGLQGLHQYRLFNALRVAAPLGWLLAVLVLYFSGQISLSAVAGAWSAVQVISGLLAYGTFVRHAHRESDVEITRTYSRKEMLAFGSRGMLGHIGPLETFRLDQLALGLFFNPAILGVYVIAQAFTNLPRFIAQSIGFVAFPAIVGKGYQNIVNGVVLKYLLAGIAVIVPIIGLLILFMPELVALFFGPEYADGVLIARILMVSALFGALRKVIVEALRGFSLPQVSTYVEILSYPVLIILGVLVVPTYAAQGMAVTVAVTNLTGLFLVLLFWRLNVSKLSKQ